MMTGAEACTVKCPTDINFDKHFMNAYSVQE